MPLIFDLSGRLSITPMEAIKWKLLSVCHKGSIKATDGFMMAYFHLNKVLPRTLRFVTTQHCVVSGNNAAKRQAAFRWH